jgi:hypothetical protein
MLVIDIIKVPNYIHPLTKEAAIYVASHLRDDDKREVTEGYGWHPLQAAIVPLEDDAVWFEVPNGKTAGMAGVSPDGQIWMLCTPAIHEYPLTFARESKRFIESRPEPVLWNIVDKRNTTHVKLLKFLGFEFGSEFKYGPNDLTFIEFSRNGTTSSSSVRSSTVC